MNEKRRKLIPYGLANYERLVQKNCYFVDKTMYLRAIEAAGDYLFFIRPRRFGKSLFLSLLEAYYDVFYKKRFAELFAETAIYKQPTEERGAYLVLKFNFSMVDPAPDNVETSFLEHIQGAALSFIRKYGGYLLKEKEYFIKTIEKSGSASDILSNLVRLCRDSRQRLYVLIDEYDNFANTILSTTGESAYKTLTHGAGSFRSFFSVLKGGTDGTDAPFSRLFLTGVSPITLDDVTSGFNIGKNISLEPHFNRLLGFSGSDVCDMIEYYREQGLVKHPTARLLEIMSEWYGNYLFSQDDDVEMLNSDMVLYFMDHYLTRQKLPEDLIDRNVRIDYGKLRHLIVVDRGAGKTPAPNGNFGKLKQVIEQGEISAKLAKGFPLEELVDTDNFISLLFYFGLLTIAAAEKDKLRLKVPNETIKRLYYDYIKSGYKEADIFDLDLSLYSDLMTDMAYDGKWQPLFEFVTGRMRESMSLRDLITGEKSIQAFLNVYLGLSNLYIIHTEKEFNKGYMDVFMEPFIDRYEGIGYAYILEIKYMKKGDRGTKAGSSKLRALIKEAEEQLAKYVLDKKYRKSIGKRTLIKLVLVFSGHELLYIGSV